MPSPIYPTPQERAQEMLRQRTAVTTSLPPLPRPTPMPPLPPPNEQMARDAANNAINYSMSLQQSAPVVVNRGSVTQPAAAAIKNIDADYTSEQQAALTKAKEEYIDAKANEINMMTQMQEATQRQMQALEEQEKRRQDIEKQAQEKQANADLLVKYSGGPTDPEEIKKMIDIAKNGREGSNESQKAKDRAEAQQKLNEWEKPSGDPGALKVIVGALLAGLGGGAAYLAGSDPSSTAKAFNDAVAQNWDRIEMERQRRKGNAAAIKDWRDSMIKELGDETAAKFRYQALASEVARDMLANAGKLKESAVMEQNRLALEKESAARVKSDVASKMLSLGGLRLQEQEVANQRLKLEAEMATKSGKEPSAPSDPRIEWREGLGQDRKGDIKDKAISELSNGFFLTAEMAKKLIDISEKYQDPKLRAAAKLFSIGKKAGIDSATLSQLEEDNAHLADFLVMYKKTVAEAGASLTDNEKELYLTPAMPLSFGDLSEINPQGKLKATFGNVLNRFRVGIDSLGGVIKPSALENEKLWFGDKTDDFKSNVIGKTK